MTRQVATFNELRASVVLDGLSGVLSELASGTLIQE